MEGLTTELAKGNLSVPIKAEKSRFFGKFLWSLDMLREKLEADKLRRLELEKEKKTLLLSLSHDIRTPLSAIELYTQALEENLYEDEEKRQQAIGGIRKNTETIKKYVGEISEAAREDFLKLDVQQGEFYLSQMMQALKLYYKEKFADLHTDFQMESFADCLLYGDLDRAVEVGQNVLENAIKYGDGKYVHISFSEEEDHSLITIENSGDGLKEEELPHIFDAFYRGSNHAGVRGSGLGLYICKELLHKMDGDIYAKRPETGFAVTIVLRKM
ncbi:MAG: HAMP domain-containing histidine kinase [Lachnospiraceae bacterium]|nr:HAMP domain-containing histidine kinase [Lachnospiraceae bacterium]RHO73573.1 sensor histidine kinase [Clostridium sp. AF43-10]